MGPDRERSLAKYRRRARGYDRIVAGGGRLLGVEAMRARVIDHLKLQGGDTVVDVGCGTGLSFKALRNQVGPDGTVIGIEQSPEMLAVARGRVEHHGWENIVLIESAVEDADIGSSADATLFCLVHDITRSRPAIERVLSQLRPGGRVALFGAKAPPRWAVPFNLLGRAMMARYVTTFEGAEHPWTVFEELVPNLSIRTRPLRTTYLAWGQVEK